MVLGIEDSVFGLLTEKPPSLDWVELSKRGLPAAPKRSARILRSTRSTCSSLGPCPV